MATVRAELGIEPVEGLDLDSETFMRAFIAALVTRGVTAIRPNDAVARRGFAKVLAVIMEALDRLRGNEASKAKLRELVRLRNEMRPSSSGSYDGVEARLRSLQLSFTNCPNPFYTEIAFTAPPTYAKATLAGTPAFGRELAEKAANAFVSELDR